VRENNLTVIRLARAPAAHVSLGFLSNAEESDLLATDEYQERLARGLADSILAYLKGAAGSRANQGGTSDEYKAIIISQPVGDLLPDATLVIPFPNGTSGTGPTPGTGARSSGG
jgi:hypothetical protein